MIRELQDKIIELRTRDLQQSGYSEDEAGRMASEWVSTFLDLHSRALIATGIFASYDKTRGDRPEPAEDPGLKFRITPPRPGLVTVPAGTAEDLLEYANTLKAADRAGKSYDFPHHLKVGGSLFNEGNPADTCCGPDEEGPVAPSDEELAYKPAGQDAEDKLGIIAAVVDSQPAFGSDLARFLRRLKLILDL